MAGLLRMLGFPLLVLTAVEISDLVTRTVGSSEGSVALIVGAFSGFLLTECGPSFAQHGWRAFAPALGGSSLLFAAASLVT